VNLYSSLDLALGLLSAYVGSIHLVYYIRLKADRERLHFALLCFSIALYDGAGALLYTVASPDSTAPWQRLQFFFSALIAMQFVNFAYCLLQRRRDAAKVAFLAIPVACVAVGLALSGYILDPGPPMERAIVAFGGAAEYYERRPGIVWNLMFVSEFLGMCYLCGLLLASYFKERKRDLLPLLLGFLAFFVSVVLDILTASGVFLIVYTAEYAFLLLIVVMDNLLLKRFIGLFNEVADLNRGLGEKVEERTQEIRKLADELLAANEELQEKNQVLTETAERDGMTALLNHAAFHQRLAELFNLSRRHRIPLAVLLLDIDYFKTINDSFGHPAGDEVIRRFADTLKAGSRSYDLKARYGEEEQQIHPALRNYDIAGRYGGDEFSVALPYCGPDEATIVAERICRMIRELEVAECPGMRFSASVGCSVLRDASAAESELQMIKLADHALYEAKAAGRDRAVIRLFEEGSARGRAESS
jgi:GGDEF domain-containing protein